MLSDNTLNSKVVNVSYNLREQTLMVKETAFVASLDFVHLIQTVGRE